MLCRFGNEFDCDSQFDRVVDIESMSDCSLSSRCISTGRCFKRHGVRRVIEISIFFSLKLPRLGCLLSCKLQKLKFQRKSENNVRYLKSARE